MAVVDTRDEVDSPRAEPAASAALVAEPMAQLTTRELAQRTGKSLAWVKKHGRALGGRIVDGSWHFPAEAISVAENLSVAFERRTTTTEKVTIGAAAPDRARARGVLAARAFALFEAVTPIESVVMRLEADPAVVRALFTEWVQCRELTARYASVPAVPVGPAFDHAPNAAWDCCPGHMAMHRMQET